MIATKGQLVRLVTEPRVGPTAPTARVIEVVYTDQEPGERGVRLSVSLGGSTWWLESDLEAAD